jgi:hypothetical protein
VQTLTKQSENKATITTTIDSTKPVKDELSEQELNAVAGGKETVTFEYGGLQIQYAQQKPDGSLR